MDGYCIRCGRYLGDDQLKSALCADCSGKLVPAANEQVPARLRLSSTPDADSPALKLLGVGLNGWWLWLYLRLLHDLHPSLEKTLLILGMAVPFQYALLYSAFSRTEIEVAAGQLRRRRRLAFAGSLDLAAKEVASLQARRGIRGWELVAVRHDSQAELLLTDLPSEDAAWQVARQAERTLRRANDDDPPLGVEVKEHNDGSWSVNWGRWRRTKLKVSEEHVRLERRWSEPVEFDTDALVDLRIDALGSELEQGTRLVAILRNDSRIVLIEQRGRDDGLVRFVERQIRKRLRIKAR
jgi:hypothetical protein